MKPLTLPQKKAKGQIVKNKKKVLFYFLLGRIRKIRVN